MNINKVVAISTFAVFGLTYACQQQTPRQIPAISPENSITSIYEENNTVHKKQPELISPKIQLWTQNYRLEELFQEKVLTKIYVSPSETECKEGQVRQEIQNVTEFSGKEICLNTTDIPSYTKVQDEWDYKVKMFSKYPKAREYAQARRELQ